VLTGMVFEIEGKGSSPKLHIDDVIATTRTGEIVGPELSFVVDGGGLLIEAAQGGRASVSRRTMYIQQARYDRIAAYPKESKDYTYFFDKPIRIGIIFAKEVGELAQVSILGNKIDLASQK
jgi:hypothetical protein